VRYDECAPVWPPSLLALVTALPVRHPAIISIALPPPPPPELSQQLDAGRSRAAALCRLQTTPTASAELTTKRRRNDDDCTYEIKIPISAASMGLKP